MGFKKGNLYGRTDMPTRGHSTRFKKGQSGNPSGLAKMRPEDKDALKILEGGKVAAAELLVKCVENPRARMSPFAWRAAIEILNRVYGRPREMIEVKTQIPFVALLPAKIEDGDVWEAQAEKVLASPAEH